MNFYEVTKAIGKRMVEIRAIYSKAIGERGGPSERVVANPGAFREGERGAPTRRLVTNDSVKVEYSGHAYIWDGSSMHKTGFGWGH